MIRLSRRKFIASAAFLAAPAIVRCASLMPVKTWLGDRLPRVVIPVIFMDGSIGARMAFRTAEGIRWADNWNLIPEPSY